MQPPVRTSHPRIRASRLAAVAFLALCAVWPATGAELGISETVELDFGAVVDRDGSVILGLGDTIVFDPFSIHVGNAVSTGHYLITGDPFATFSLSITGSTVGGLSIGSFETTEGTPPLLNVALGLSGQLDLGLGGTLTVNSGQAAPGNDQPLLFTITVNYN